MHRSLWLGIALIFSGIALFGTWNIQPTSSPSTNVQAASLTQNERDPNDCNFNSPEGQTPARQPKRAVSYPPVAPRPVTLAIQDEDSITVYITDTGEKYHRAGCQYLRYSSHAVSLRDAKRRGYDACKVCRPPR